MNGEDFILHKFSECLTQGSEVKIIQCDEDRGYHHRITAIVAVIDSKNSRVLIHIPGQLAKWFKTSDNVIADINMEYPFTLKFFDQVILLQEYSNCMNKFAYLIHSLSVITLDLSMIISLYVAPCKFLKHKY
jgi:hypothetical protein